jgi:type IX secretion system PorP/SprF family membrane protein
MKKLHYIVLTALLLASSAIFAQQESLFTFYRSNMNIVNPAYAGVDKETLVTSALRSQWTGIADAPQTQTVTFGTPLAKNMGIGISMVSDKTFIEKQTFLGIDFSYKLKMNENTDLYLGIKAGGNFYDVNTSGLETYNIISDPALASISNFNPNVGVGALLKQDKWYASLSVPRLLSTTRARNEAGYAMTDLDRPHAYLSGGYDYFIDALLTFKPSVMLRYVNGAPVSVDLNANLQIDDNFEIGVMYRIDRAYAAMSTIKLSKRFVVGFAYEISTSPTLVAVARDTNEIFLQFKF